MVAIHARAHSGALTSRSPQVCCWGLDNSAAGGYVVLVWRPSGLSAYIGSGWVVAALRPAFQGSNWQGSPQGEGSGQIDEGVGFRVSSRGISVSRVVAPRGESDARCASLALSHLSLSLSLSSSRGLGSEGPHPARSRRLAVFPAGGGVTAVWTARTPGMCSVANGGEPDGWSGGVLFRARAARVDCSAADGCAPAAVLCCPEAVGRGVCFLHEELI